MNLSKRQNSTAKRNNLSMGEYPPNTRKSPGQKEPISTNKENQLKSFKGQGIIKNGSPDNLRNKNNSTLASKASFSGCLYAKKTSAISNGEGHNENSTSTPNNVKKVNEIPATVNRKLNMLQNFNQQNSKNNQFSRTNNFTGKCSSPDTEVNRNKSIRKKSRKS